MKRANGLSILVAMVCALSVIAPALFSQDAAPTLLQVNLLQVKPDMMDRFRELHRDVFMPAGKESGTALRATSETVYGQSFEMAVAVQLENFAQLDKGPSGLSETEAALAGRLWAQTVDSRRSFIVQLRPDLSLAPAPASDLSRRVRIVVASGKAAEFEATWIAEILPAIEKSGAKGYQVYQTVLGGNNAEYWGIMPLASFSVLDNWNVFSGLSDEDAAALNARTGELIDSIEIAVTRLDRELSYGLQ